MLMVLKEIQPTDTLPPASTSGIDYTACATPITQPQFQGQCKQQVGRGIRSAFKRKVKSAAGKKWVHRQVEFKAWDFNNHHPHSVLLIFRPNRGRKAGHCNGCLWNMHIKPKRVPSNTMLFRALADQSPCILPHCKELHFPHLFLIFGRHFTYCTSTSLTLPYFLNWQQNLRICVLGFCPRKQAVNLSLLICFNRKSSILSRRLLGEVFLTSQESTEYWRLHVRLLGLVKHFGF